MRIIVAIILVVDDGEVAFIDGVIRAVVSGDDLRFPLLAKNEKVEFTADACTLKGLFNRITADVQLVDVDMYSRINTFADIIFTVSIEGVCVLPNGMSMAEAKLFAVIDNNVLDDVIVERADVFELLCDLMDVHQK